MGCILDFKPVPGNRYTGSLAELDFYYGAAWLYFAPPANSAQPSDALSLYVGIGYIHYSG
jgi:hypothetical protein